MRCHAAFGDIGRCRVKGRPATRADRHSGACAREPQRNRSPDAPAAARNNCSFTAETYLHKFLLPNCPAARAWISVSPPSSFTIQSEASTAKT
jgi:hypothetical protein